MNMIMKLDLKKNEAFKLRVTRLEHLVGTRISLNCLSSAEALSNLSFDWFFIDMEHTDIPEHQLSSILLALSDKPSLVRVSKNEDIYIKKAMDAGAAGVIVPKVSNMIDAKKAVLSFKMPPSGTRGIGLTRSNNFGHGLDNYLENIERSSLLVVQIEDSEGVENIKSILDVKGIDAVFVGPYDLSISLGIANKFDSEKFKAALDKIIEACKENRMPLGIFESNENRITKLKTSGFTFFCLSSDISFLINDAKRILINLKE